MLLDAIRKFVNRIRRFAIAKGACDETWEESKKKKKRKRQRTSLFQPEYISD